MNQDRVTTLPSDQFMDLGDRSRIAATMAKAVALVYSRKIYTATMCLIANYIDAISGGNKDNYNAFMKQHFPELCQQLNGAHIFYENFRSGMVHYYSPKKGYALLEDTEANGRYVARVRIGEAEYVGLNVDRLAKEFIALAESLAEQSIPEGG